MLPRSAMKGLQKEKQVLCFHIVDIRIFTARIGRAGLPYGAVANKESAKVIFFLALVKIKSFTLTCRGGREIH